MNDEELCQWLRDNSSGIYRNSELGACRIEELLIEVEDLKYRIHCIKSFVDSEVFTLDKSK